MKTIFHRPAWYYVLIIIILTYGIYVISKMSDLGV